MTNPEELTEEMRAILTQEQTWLPPEMRSTITQAADLIASLTPRHSKGQSNMTNPEELDWQYAPWGDGSSPDGFGNIICPSQEIIIAKDVFEQNALAIIEAMKLRQSLTPKPISEAPSHEVCFLLGGTIIKKSQKYLSKRDNKTAVLAIKNAQGVWCLSYGNTRKEVIESTHYVPLTALILKG